MERIHIAVSTWPLLGKNFSFHPSGLTSIWPIAYRELSMLLLVECWCHFWSIRRCFLGRWTCLIVSEDHHLVWRCHVFDQSTCIPSFLRRHGGLCYLQMLVPDYVAGIRLGRCIFQKHYVIGVVHVHNCLCGVSSASGGARGVFVIVVGNEHDDTSSNPGRDWLHFT